MITFPANCWRRSLKISWLMVFYREKFKPQEARLTIQFLTAEKKEAFRPPFDLLSCFPFKADFKARNIFSEKIFLALFIDFTFRKNVVNHRKDHDLSTSKCFFRHGNHKHQHLRPWQIVWTRETETVSIVRKGREKIRNDEPIYKRQNYPENVLEKKIAPY